MTVSYFTPKIQRNKEIIFCIQNQGIIFMAMKHICPPHYHNFYLNVSIYTSLFVMPLMYAYLILDNIVKEIFTFN